MGHGLSIRGDMLYCPLAFSLDSYWNCLTDCVHCYLRRLNQTWGQDLRPTDTEETGRKLRAGLKNKNPHTPLAIAIAKKKALRFGNKTDPFQDAEAEHRVSFRLMKLLRELEWETVIQTMHTARMMEYENMLVDRVGRETFIVQPIISPGAERDWILLERKRTTPPQDRLLHIQMLQKQGVRVAVNGEPFIPGYHTVDEFEDMILRLKSAGVLTYNTYNLHMNEFVVKRFHAAGMDIARIWEMNQDKYWKPIQRQLCLIAEKHGVYLGCPDFVNTGPGHVQTTNTCCGPNVARPMTYNSHFFKRYLQNGNHSAERIEELCWEGIGDREQGRDLLTGTPDCKFFTMRDAGLVK